MKHKCDYIMNLSNLVGVLRAHDIQVADGPAINIVCDIVRDLEQNSGVNINNKLVTDLSVIVAIVGPIGSFNSSSFPDLVDDPIMRNVREIVQNEQCKRRRESTGNEFQHLQLKWSDLLEILSGVILFTTNSNGMAEHMNVTVSTSNSRTFANSTPKKYVPPEGPFVVKGASDRIIFDASIDHGPARSGSFQQRYPCIGHRSGKDQVLKIRYIDNSINPVTKKVYKLLARTWDGYGCGPMVFGCSLTTLFKTMKYQCECDRDRRTRHNTIANFSIRELKRAIHYGIHMGWMKTTTNKHTGLTMYILKHGRSGLCRHGNKENLHEKTGRLIDKFNEIGNDTRDDAYVPPVPPTK